LETAIRMKLDLTVIVVNNAASGYVKALQHLMYGADAYQASDLHEMNYATIAKAMGAHGQRVDGPETLESALKAAIAHKGPSIIDVVVTRDPAKMLPGVDNRTVKVKKGDRVA
jgi:acetolactate synthase I/II/III large subunit